MTSTPAGQQTDRGGRFPFGGHLTDLGYAAGWRVVRAMPEFMARNAFDAGAHYAARNGGPEQLRKNLARVIGVDARQGAGRADSCFAGLIRPILAGGVPVADDGPEGAWRVSSTRSWSGREHIAAALDAGRGAVLALPHSGNWDMAGVWLVDRHGTFTTVTERLKPESLYNRFIAYRESLGFEMLPLTGGERPPFEVLAERLRDNRVVCLMAERDLTRTGVQVDFFGEPTRMPAGSAKLAIETGAHLHAGALLVHGARLGFQRAGAAGHVVRRRRASSRRSWPTSSPATSPRTRPTGT